MNTRHKSLFALLLTVSIFGAGWYLLFYPEEPWIRYNFVVRSAELSALANYIEGQNNFNEFSCIENDVWLDMRKAPQSTHDELQKLCRSSRIGMGERTEYGSFFHLGFRKRWFDEYWIAVVHSPSLNAATTCSRWRKPDAAEECIVRLTNEWAIHYRNATLQNEDVKGLAEDVARSQAP